MCAVLKDMTTELWIRQCQCQGAEPVWTDVLFSFSNQCSCDPPSLTAMLGLYDGSFSAGDELLVICIVQNTGWWVVHKVGSKGWGLLPAHYWVKSIHCHERGEDKGARFDILKVCEQPDLVQAASMTLLTFLLTWGTAHSSHGYADLAEKFPECRYVDAVQGQSYVILVEDRRQGELSGWLWACRLVTGEFGWVGENMMELHPIRQPV